MPETGKTGFFPGGWEQKNVEQGTLNVEGNAGVVKRES